MSLNDTESVSSFQFFSLSLFHILRQINKTHMKTALACASYMVIFIASRIQSVHCGSELLVFFNGFLVIEDSLDSQMMTGQPVTNDFLEQG